RCAAGRGARRLADAGVSPAGVARGGPPAEAVTPGQGEDAMERTDPLDHRIVQEFEALLLKQRVRLRESVRARMTERRMGEPRWSPEDEIGRRRVGKERRARW